MNPEQQRITIAEACGYWFYKESTDINTRVYAGPPGSGRYRFLGFVGGDTAGPNPLPNYPSDLNAMHEAEKTICGENFDTPLWMDYLRNLDRVINKRRAHATAYQRAEAFLRTLNLWTSH